LAAATFVPACIGGVPLFMSLLSYLGTSGLSRVVEWSMTHASVPVPGAPGVVPVPQEEPES
jgi:hypothetical protein